MDQGTALPAKGEAMNDLKFGAYFLFACCAFMVALIGWSFWRVYH
jgi:hypothetical protein